MRAPSRDRTPPWFRPVSERLSPTITTLVVINTLTFALYAVVRQTRPLVLNHLALGPDALLRGEVWQLFTSLFVHLEPWSFFFGMIGLWFVGATIERQLGRRKFLVLFFVPALLGNLAMAGLLLVVRTGEVFAGPHLAVLALFVAFGRIYDRTPARILGGLVLEARTLTLILIAFTLFSDILRGSVVALTGDVVALVSSYVLSGGRGAGLRELFTRFGSRSRRRFHVVDGGRPRPPSRKDERRSGYLN